MTRLLLCDDSREARVALKTMLASEPAIEVVGEAADGREAIARAETLRPDVVLMDVAMPVLDGIDATRRIKELLPATRIIAFAGSEEGEIVSAMLEAGASAYCVKGAPLWELTRAITSSSDGLVHLAQTLARGVNGQSAGQIVARELAVLVSDAATAVYVAAGDVALSLGGSSGFPSGAPLSSAPGLAVRAFRCGAPAQADRDELAELARLGVPASAALAVPLASDGEVLGSLVVASLADVVPDEETVFAVADLAATAIQAERALALTFAEARRDALTGVPNRRALEERLADLLARGRTTSLVLFDLDDFKAINDAEGHAAGDETLCEVARVCQRALRADEDVYRLGGDEFVVVIEGGREVAARVGTRLRGALLRHRRRRELPSISCGVATGPEDGADAGALLRRADRALYAAKRSGKNQVVSFSPGIEPQEDTGSNEALHERAPVGGRRSPRLLIVEDDPVLRALLRTTLEVTDAAIAEAGAFASARVAIAAGRPDVVVLDPGLPDGDGLELCRELKAGPDAAGTAVLVLTGHDDQAEDDAREAGADAFLHKPFSPLELLACVGRLLSGSYEGPVRAPEPAPAGQLLFYAQDIRRLLEIERGQRALLEQAYNQTVTALAAALESKDTGTGAHSHRVERYASELASALAPELLADPSLGYGFLLHDVGKISIPDRILLKPGALTPSERRVLQTHTVLGEQMLRGVSVLQGEGLKVVRSHHERWDGRGYPDGLRGEEAPLGARIFAVADALDAMTSNRPYRAAGRWDDALTEIVAESGHQFDPNVVQALQSVEPKLRRVYYELTASDTGASAEILSGTEA